MGYKDKDKQRATTRKRVRRYRAKLKGVTYKPKGNAQDVTPQQEAMKRLKALQGEKNVCATEVAHLAEAAGIRPFAGLLTKERQISRKGFND